MPRWELLLRNQWNITNSLPQDCPESRPVSAWGFCSPALASWTRRLLRNDIGKWSILRRDHQDAVCQQAMTKYQERFEILCIAWELFKCKKDDWIMEYFILTFHERDKDSKRNSLNLNELLSTEFAKLDETLFFPALFSWDPWYFELRPWTQALDFLSVLWIFSGWCRAPEERQGQESGSGEGLDTGHWTGWPGLTIQMMCGDTSKEPTQGLRSFWPLRYLSQDTSHV